MSTGDDAAIRLTALLGASDDAIITTNPAGEITSWNAAAEQLFGFSASEVLGQSIRLLHLDDSGHEEQAILARAMNRDAIRDVDAVRRRRDGGHVAIALTVVPLLSPADEVIGTLRIARDVSGRDRAERAARRLAAIVESSDDAIVSKDLNGVVMSWNAAAEKMFGYRAPEIIGRSIRTIIPADRQSEEDQVLAAIRRGDKVDHFETIRRHKNGRFVPISLTVSPVRDANGRIVGASKIARDISEKKRAEAERARLLASAEQHAAITEKLNQVGAIVASGLDRTKIVQAVADTATELTTAQFGVFFFSAADSDQEQMLHIVSGVAREQVPGVHAMPPFDSTLKGAVRSDDITKDQRYANLPRDPGMGHFVVRSYLAVPVRARSGEVLGGLCFGHSDAGVFDERHERLAVGVASWAAVALENARLYADVQQTSRLKDEFLATLSHELRTPLNAILGYARMVRGGIIPPDRQANAIATIERNATSLTQIVEDVLDVSRIISGKLRLNVQPVDLADVVRNVIDGVTPAADAKGIRIESILDPRAGPVSGDPERLQQVVWNLLSNAVKFTGRGGRVHVTVQRTDSRVDVIVADTGIGIAPNFLPHIFDRFRQADSSTTRERGGLGLGLAIVRQLVEMHGGRVDAASDGPGRGSTFRIGLPLIPVHAVDAGRGEHPVTERAGAPLSVPDLHGVRVLVVDDDRDTLEMVREILQAAGADVSLADSAASAIGLVASVKPDVIVSDLGMPRVDGFELIGRIRQSDDPAVRDVPAAALTAYARSEDRVRALRSGFQLHLAKPIDPTELLAAVLALVKRGPVISPRPSIENPHETDRDTR